MSSVQDWPGRAGFWEVGVPPSGPVDDRSLRLGNRLVGNPPGAAALEVTLTGPKLRFDRAATVAVTGAPIPVKFDGEPVDQWQAFEAPAGGLLALGTIRGVGPRAYVTVRGGIDTEPVMGSRSVFVAGRLGGAPLKRGDRLPVGTVGVLEGAGERLVGGPAGLAPVFGNAALLRVVLGPHGAPDFLTPAGLDELFAADWSVDPQSDRTGVRLVGPRPQWARTDGGEAGLHPSNVLDSAYGVGTVMLAGDMAVIVGPDGPSLGGFAAVAQVIRADRWRIGQLRAGDCVRLEPVGAGRAAALHVAAEAALAGTAPPAKRVSVGRGRSPKPDFGRPLDGAHGPVTYRRAGECAVLVEFGDPVIDLRSRVRVSGLQDALLAERIDGVRDLTPGVRSLHVQHESERIDTDALVGVLTALEAALPPPEALPVTGRVVYLPLAWRHSLAERAVERYAASIRPDAPWCPDDIDFILRINGLADEWAVQEIVTAAAYLVLGLGDVYLGAPVAVPLDPRHRLVTSKYTPARTWTPANAVGIGGAFLCVYGMEGPGGYQLVGRTVPIWASADDPPWRLRHFDQLRFDLVSEEDLETLREESEAGRWRPRTEPADFSLLEHEKFVGLHAAEIELCTRRREAAFAAERGAWAASAELAAALVA